MHPTRLSILGVGLLGGSLGLAAKARIKGCEVTGYAHRASTLQAALQRGAIDVGFDNPWKAVIGADLIVLCTPVGMLAQNLQEISEVAVSAGAVVTDVGSTKASVVAAAEKEHPAMHFVGSHPMAGSEKRGVEFATPDLFENAVCIVTPTERTNRDALEKTESFWKTLGMRIKRISPTDHDRLMGSVSHLPHALAAALVDLQEDAALELAGKGFLDSTRIAGGDGGLWRDILLDNRENLKASLSLLRGKIDELEGMLDPAKSDELRAWLDHAAERRRSIGSKS
jgi:prephenate dehydrogenase